MGLFSSVGKFLTGGSSGSSSAKSGFPTLPKELQDFYKSFATEASKATLPSSADLSTFTPLGITDQEQYAIDTAATGLAPTPESLSRDVSMFMNPYDDYVIDAINREAEGENSILQSALDKAGQFASNREILGANDIDQKRLQQIGVFKQGQYDKAIDNVLNNLSGLRQQDIANSLGIGEFLRSLDLETKQAPLNALDYAAKYLGVLPESGGSTQVDRDWETRKVV